MMFRRRGHSAEYRAHLRSPEWARIRRAALERAEYRCAFCGLTRDRLRLKGRHLEVHHNTYRNLGHEQPADLTVLCAGGRGACHAAADRQRRSGAGRRPRTARRRRRRMRGPLRELRTSVMLFAMALGGLKLAAVLLPPA